MPRIFTTLILYRQTVTFTLTVLVSIVLLSLSPQNQVLVSRSVMMTVLTPVQQVFSFIPSFFNLRQENQLLREELVTLQLQNADLRESTHENQRLRSLLGFKQRPEFTYLPAEVIAHDAGRVLNGVVIDMGSRDGVRPYMAVVTSQGLAGRVVETGPLSSLVQLLTDRSCRISSIVERSRVKGTIAGRLYDGLDLMLPLRADVRIGDNVVSSGLGGTFPPGLLVGRVQGLRIEESGVFKQIDIAPVVDFDRLEEVFVVVPKAAAGGDSMSAISSSDYQSLLPGRDETALSSRR